MSKTTTALLACGVALTSAACLIPLTVREHFNQRGLGAASFQLQCPPEQIQVVSLSRPLDEGITPGDQVGVSGCGRRAVYMVTMRGMWVLNGQGASGPPMVAPYGPPDGPPPAEPSPAAQHAAPPPAEPPPAALPPR
jgi:hypothetical protein